MSGYNIDIADMQCWVFRMAQSKWKMSPSDCAELFKKYDILGFIADCYDILHLNSYECVSRINFVSELRMPSSILNL